jgi:hypothetical protein
MPYDATLQTPFNALIVGPTQSGKTTLLYKLLQYSQLLLTTPPKHKILFYKYNQPTYTKMLNDNLIQEIIPIESNNIDYDSIVEKITPFKNIEGSMLIFDDSMGNFPKNFDQVFTNLSHHNNCSVIIISQMLFRNDESFRSISRNAHYIFLMKNDRDKLSISNFANQTCPGNKNFLIQSYNNATLNPYSYLLMDFTQKSPPELKLRAQIFPEEFPYTVYIP